ncbi:EAL and HDOD domain-containing protein [Noviherbaspirillum pedocola]|uniref:HDOD domain-containing protein n=1 Tax=Noviherbaspirillum pedocola TaxID=2801341 RepID=A0A934T1X2_9BURK|nr:HDOD domain-containing protein [Noviherbaspirillum pedocola]MBK4736178.1 HDOD domain-containing protein [Noviherbaspirillum pedocola]
MQAPLFLTREPLLDPARKVLAYSLNWQAIASTGHDCERLLLLLASELNDAAQGWTLLRGHLVVPATPEVLRSAVPQTLWAPSVTFNLDAEDSLDADTCTALRRRGFGIGVRGVPAELALAAHATFFELDGSATYLRAQLSDVAGLRSRDSRVALRNIASWAQYESCAAAGIDVYAGRLVRAPVPPHAGGLNSTQSNILQIINLVNRNADVRDIEAALKREPAVSFKLFRYINSAGVSPGAEITSLRHAVTMLGYRALYRWLSVLLASSSSSTYSAALMQTAVIRGRLVELLGQGLVPKYESENLFVAGMFSLLDQMLGMPMQKVLEKVPLAEPLAHALTDRRGVYGPFLALAESCEDDSGNSRRLADRLFMEAEQVNAAHLAALVWAMNLQV